jgi:DNA polymerase-1
VGKYGGKYQANTSHKFLRLPNKLIYVYNLHDSYWTAKLFFALRREMQDPALGQQWPYYVEWIQPLQKAARRMQARGLLLDKPAKSVYRKRVVQDLMGTDLSILQAADQAGFEYDSKFPNSDQQVARFLYANLGLKCHKWTPTGRPSVDQEALTRILRKLRKKDQPHVPTLHSLLHRSRLSKIIENYLDVSADPDGRVRPKVKLTGTKTFRYAYAEPALQQFPEETRHLFKAEPGKLLLAADFSQLEARILAILAGDEISLRVFKEGGDVHAQNARDLLGLSEAEWSGLGAGAKPRRNLAKTFLYGISYGGDPEQMKTKGFCPCPKCADKVPQTLELTRPRLKAAGDRWFQVHGAVRRWQAELIQEVSRRNYYESPFGLRRYVGQPWGAAFEREVKNIPMQMNGAILMNRCQVQLDRIDTPIIFQQHDSFLSEIPDTPGSLVDQHMADLKGIMEQPVPELAGESFPIDLELGENWGTASPENPHGLRKVTVDRPTERAVEACEQSEADRGAVPSVRTSL